MVTSTHQDQDQTRREVADLLGAIERAEDPAAKAEALSAVAAHPCAHHEVVLTAVFADLAVTWRQLGRYDEAIQAYESAIGAGLSEVPHPRTAIAETLLQAGRREEADALFDRLGGLCPNDVWLRNAAGFSYADAGDPAVALRWLDEGLTMAMDHGDPEDIVGQLAGQRAACRRTLDLDDDALTERIAGFVRPSQSAGELSRREFFNEVEPLELPCDHCGWMPDEPWATPADKVGRNAPCPCGSGQKHKHCCGR